MYKPRLMTMPAVYWGSQSLINTVFLVSSSYLVAATSWRYFYWVLAIFAGVGLLLGFFFLIETRYERSPMSMNGHVVHTDEWSITHFLTHDEAMDRLGDVRGSAGADTPRMSYLQQLRPFHGAAKNPLKLGLGAELKMLQACSSPAVVFAILGSSISLGLSRLHGFSYPLLMFFRHRHCNFFDLWHGSHIKIRMV
jgi:hypothetical protein